MKNFIKKIAYTFSFLAFLGLGFAALPTEAAAFVAFNNDPQDYATFRGMNVSDYPNGTNWISTTVSADAGETISFDIYYHNTGNTTANNVKLKVSPESTGTGTSHTFTGSISADGYGGLSDSVSVSLSSSQSLTYIDNSATWFPNQTTTGSAISDSSLFSSGINIGSVAPGWSSQGHLRVQFKVSGNTDDGDAQCDDNEDNDGDGYTDMDDPSCDSIYDDSESPYDGGDDASAPNTTTLSAVDVDEDSAVLRGEADANGDSIDNCWFEWGTNDAVGDLDNTEDASCSIGDDDTEEFSENLTGLSDGEDYYYRACAENAEGTDCGSILHFETSTEDTGSDQEPSVTTLSEDNVDEDSATLRGEVDANDDSVDSCWFEWGTNDAIDDLDETENVSCSISSDDTEEFSETITGLDEDEDYYYRACAESDLGEDCGSIMSFTTDSDDNDNPDIDYSNVTVSTVSATSITQTSATLSGFVYNTSNDNPTGWFEYGPTTYMGLYSSQQLLGTNSTLSYFNTATGLVANTTYYYRAVVRADDGTLKYGQVLTFRTLSYSVPVVPVVINTGTTISTGTGNGDIMLTIDSRYENVYMGDIVDYTLIYKNISGKTLQNATLRVLFPQNINFRNSSIGDYSLADHALTIQLGTLIPNQTGTFYIQGVVANSARLGELLVTTASLVYTDPKGAQQEAIAYEMNRVSTSRNPLLGLAFFSGLGFFPNTLLGWLLLILVIFALVYLARRVYTRRPTPNFN
ncbi:MAG: hypothetical protein KBD26_00270 [Candidatus Pacebacteria bacterium]|nr:hypothetical protein [Candidatus Paceibacterota bacterium]MBP9772250.1 hypothetical protein [Candidatus Paceibacterota bacterium]QQR76903.1 MAG: hypothetical protein IPJ63_01410 [Candidatus Nomurabacteria bacterium]